MDKSGRTSVGGFPLAWLVAAGWDKHADGSVALVEDEELAIGTFTGAEIGSVGQPYALGVGGCADVTVITDQDCQTGYDVREMALAHGGR